MPLFDLEYIFTAFINYQFIFMNTYLINLIFFREFICGLKSQRVAAITSLIGCQKMETRIATKIDY